MGEQARPQIAFMLSLIGGILILFAGIVCCSWFGIGGLSVGGMMMGWGSMMGGYYAMMRSIGVPFSFMSGFSLIGLVSGIMVIIGAVALSIRPTEHTGWGVVILVFSVISFLGLGGFLVGAVLGIVGGSRVKLETHT